MITRLIEKLKEIIANVDIRGNKILLPESVTNISKFGEKDEVIIEADKGYVLVKKSGVEEGKKGE